MSKRLNLEAKIVDIFIMPLVSAICVAWLAPSPTQMSTTLSRVMARAETPAPNGYCLQPPAKPANSATQSFPGANTQLIRSDVAGSSNNSIQLKPIQCAWALMRTHITVKELWMRYYFLIINGNAVLILLLSQRSKYLPFTLILSQPEFLDK